MELVEGLTLAERIKQGALPLDEALSMAKQIAEALEYAHERGIIHRDLKPSNVKLTPDGQVKVLDFGLAKALEGETSEEELQNSPTLSAAATRAGVLLGTAAYMSPEQARGKRVDRRADIWAFGCVLYEMLTGQGAFAGETTSDILACVIRAEPDWSFLPASLPPAIRALLRRCLQKDPKQRLRDIGDARIAIEETLGDSSATGTLRVTPPTNAFQRHRMLWIFAAVGLVLGTAIAGLIAWNLRPASVRPVVSRFSFVFTPPGDQPAVSTGYPLTDYPVVALSRDGTDIAYVGRSGETTQIFLRRLDRLDSQPLAGTVNATSPFFSPDGEWVAFFADGKLKKVSVHGGDATTLCDAPVNRSGSWGPDNEIVFATIFSGVMRVSANGGPPETLNAPDGSKGELSYRWPEILPAGNAVMFVIAGAKDIGFFSESKIAVERLDTHERKILPIQGTYPRYSPSGHLVFAREGRLFAARFDLKRLEVTGAPVPVLDGVKSILNSGAANFMISETGSLVYVPENSWRREGLLTWVDRRNQFHELAAPARRYGSPHISPDGQRVAISVFSGGKTDVWVYEISYGRLTRLTFDEGSATPVWSPDGKQIVFSTRRGSDTGRGAAIVSKAADGSGAEETLVSGESLIEIPTSWSPDGNFLAFWNVGPEGRRIWMLPLRGDRKPQAFVQTRFNQQQARFSRDGNWVAYTSDESGRWEVYVQPFPGPGGKWQISRDGGGWPVWSRDGRELFFISSNQLMSVEVTTRPSFSASVPRVVADAPPSLMPTFASSSVYDVSPDGQRFLFVKANEEKGPLEEVRVVLNWTEELKQVASAGKQP
jgi:serine/threonine-protein kinase